MKKRQLLTGLIEMAAAAAEQPARTRDLVWFTGIDVPRYDFWSDTEWTLRLPMDRARLDRLNAGAPLMKDHSYMRSIDNQVGVIEKAWIQNGKGMATVRFADTPDVEPIWQKVQDGILRSVSMEAAIDDYEDVTPRGQKTKVLAATGWEVEAIALVPVPADPDAQFMASFSHSPLPTNFGANGASGAPNTEPLNKWLTLKRAALRLY